MTTDDLPPWLSTKEAALKVLLWLSCQPDPPLRYMRVLCELAELSPCLRAGLLNPRRTNVLSRHHDEALPA
jgi:hypothetical protein